jgi:hypothetical protein
VNLKEIKLQDIIEDDNCLIAKINGYFTGKKGINIDF